MFQGSYTLYGSERSFFTRKVEAILRYMEIPYTSAEKSPLAPSPLDARAGTHVIPVLHTPEDWMLWDSTPIAVLLDSRFQERRIIPTTPVQRIAARMFEDWFDEWFTRAAMYTRWQIPGTAEYIVRHGAAQGLFAKLPADLDEEQRATVEQIVAQNAPAMQHHMGDVSCPRIAATLEAGRDIPEWFEAFLLHLVAHLEQHPYLLGERPCVADFVVVGSCKAHFTFDPWPRALIERVAPTVLEYVERTWNAVAGDEAWLADDVVPGTWKPFWDELEARFARYLVANRSSLERGEGSLELDLGHGEVELVAVPYRERSRLDVRDEILRLDSAARARVHEALPAGVLEVYELPPVGGLAPFVPHAGLLRPEG